MYRTINIQGPISSHRLITTKPFTQAHRNEGLGSLQSKQAATSTGNLRSTHTVGTAKKTTYKSQTTTYTKTDTELRERGEKKN